jgi:hypothetical protein
MDLHFFEPVVEFVKRCTEVYITETINTNIITSQATANRSTAGDFHSFGKQWFNLSWVTGCHE